MINEELIKEFCTFFDATPSHDSEKEAFFLAKLYIETSAKMPEKSNCTTLHISEINCKQGKILCSDCYRNKAIEECTISAMKMLEEKDKEIDDHCKERFKFEEIIDQKDNEIGEISGELINSRKHISRLESQLLNRDKLIAELEKQLDEKK